MTTRAPRLLHLAVGLVAVLALAACGGDDDAADATPADQSVTVRTGEYFFDPEDIVVDAGRTEIVVDNSGGVIEHDLTVDELGIEIFADPGQTVSEVVDLRTGSYEVYCSIPGHREAGMVGTLTVN